MTKLKDRWSLGHNHMTGVTAGKWFQLLREVNFDVDMAYWHRFAFISTMSLFNAGWAGLESLIYDAKIQETKLERPPIFVLGHWRSGTTHLHNLLCVDQQFAFSNTYQVVNPFTFLLTEKVNTRLFNWLLPKTRPMDNVRLSFAEPQEDELGLCLAGLRSLYLGISFPRLEPEFQKYLTFEDASQKEIETFKATILWFVKKLTLKHGKQIVLKSPCHTARIKLLLEVFPNAKFVHIHRDPYTVFKSSQKYYNTAVWFTYLQKPDRERVDDEILRRYVRLHEAFFEQKDLIPPGHFSEISFDELDANPMATVEKIYRDLTLGDFEAMKAELESYVGGLRSYQKNKHADLPEVLKTRVRQEWKRCFEEWSYPT